jgi:hypothetical protein
VAGDKPGELFVSHFGFVHPETIDAHPMNRLGIIRSHRDFSAPLAIDSRPHFEFTPWNPNHAFRRRSHVNGI